MKWIAIGMGLCVALLVVVTNVEALQYQDVSVVGFAPADTVPMPRGLELLQPGVPVRASFALCGDTRRPVTELTGTFVELEPNEAFEMEVIAGDRKQLHQVAIDDLLSIEVGTERSLTTRGAVIGALSGAVLGVAGAAIGASGSPGDAEYASGAAIAGLVGAGVGALIGNRSTTIEWQELPLYGPAYCD
jgi:hypothetical protein